MAGGEDGGGGGACGGGDLGEGGEGDEGGGFLEGRGRRFVGGDGGVGLLVVVRLLVRLVLGLRFGLDDGFGHFVVRVEVFVCWCAGRGWWWAWGIVLCLQVGDALFEVAEVVDAGLEDIC